MRILHTLRHVGRKLKLLMCCLLDFVITENKNKWKVSAISFSHVISCLITLLNCTLLQVSSSGNPFIAADFAKQVALVAMNEPSRVPRESDETQVELLFSYLIFFLFAYCYCCVDRPE